MDPVKFGNCVIKVNSNSLIENSIFENNYNPEVRSKQSLHVDYSVIEGGESSFTNPYGGSNFVASICNTEMETRSGSTL